MRMCAQDTYCYMHLFLLTCVIVHMCTLDIVIYAYMCMRILYVSTQYIPDCVLYAGARHESPRCVNSATSLRNIYTLWLEVSRSQQKSFSLTTSSNISSTRARTLAPPDWSVTLTRVSFESGRRRAAPAPPALPAAASLATRCASRIWAAQVSGA